MVRYKQPGVFCSNYNFLAITSGTIRHLRLVDCAYACLTHLGLKTQCAQAKNKSKKVLRFEPISKLKDRTRRVVWRENVQDVIK